MLQYAANMQQCCILLLHGVLKISNHQILLLHQKLHIYTKFQFNPARIQGFTEYAALCSKYAAVCSKRAICRPSTHHGCFSHPKKPPFPNFHARLRICSHQTPINPTKRRLFWLRIEGTLGAPHQLLWNCASSKSNSQQWKNSYLVYVQNSISCFLSHSLPFWAAAPKGDKVL